MSRARRRQTFNTFDVLFIFLLRFRDRGFCLLLGTIATRVVDVSYPDAQKMSLAGVYSLRDDIKESRSGEGKRKHPKVALKRSRADNYRSLAEEQLTERASESIIPCFYYVSVP